MTTNICDERTAFGTLVYSENGFSGRRSLTYNGQALTRKSNKEFVLPASESTPEQVFKVTGNAFTGVQVSCALFPAAVVVRRKLTPLEYILAILPLIPAVFFGAVGGAVGGLCMGVSFCLQLQIPSKPLKVVIGIELGAIGGLAAFLCAYGVALLLL